MNRRNFLYSILAPFLIPLLPKDWRATKTLCRASLERQRGHVHTINCVIGCTGSDGPRGPQGISVNHGHGSGDFNFTVTNSHHWQNPANRS